MKTHSKLHRIYVKRSKNDDLPSNICFEADFIGTETGFQKMSRCPRSVSLGRRYPVPISKIEYEVSRMFFRRPKSDQEICSIYRSHGRKKV